MFRTHDAAKLPYAHRKGEHSWSYAEIKDPTAWFYVTCTVRHENKDFTEIFLFSEVRHLLDLDARDNMKIKYVDVVTPPETNGSGRSKMEPLREIWLCSSDKYPNNQDYIYLVQSGAQYRLISAVSLVNKFAENGLLFRTKSTFPD